MLLEVRMEHLLNAGVHAKHILLSTYSAQSTRFLWESVWGKYCPTLHTKFRTTPNGNRMKLASHARLLPSSACCEGQACKQASQTCSILKWRASIKNGKEFRHFAPYTLIKRKITSTTLRTYCERTISLRAIRFQKVTEAGSAPC